MASSKGKAQDDEKVVAAANTTTGVVLPGPVVPATASDINPQQEPEDLPTMKELVGVRYIGPFNQRRIRASDLRANGIDPKEDSDLVWNDDNNKFIHSDEINAATRDFLALQPDLQVE